MLNLYQCALVNVVKLLLILFLHPTSQHHKMNGEVQTPLFTRNFSNVFAFAMKADLVKMKGFEATVVRDPTHKLEVNLTALLWPWSQNFDWKLSSITLFLELHIQWQFIAIAQQVRVIQVNQEWSYNKFSFLL